MSTDIQPTSATELNLAAGSLPRHTSLTFLLVDDAPYIAKALERDLGLVGEMKYASNNKEALDLLASAKVDLVILDGDLGDNNFGPSGLSASVYSAAVKLGISVIRLTANPNAIPDELRGQACFPKASASASSLLAWIEKNFPRLN